MVDVLLSHGRLSEDVVASVKQFITENQTFSVGDNVAPPKALGSMKKRLAYGERALLAQNPTAKRLFEIMEEKQSNLSLAADVTTAEELLAIADQVWHTSSYHPFVSLFPFYRKKERYRESSMHSF